MKQESKSTINKLPLLSNNYYINKSFLTQSYTKTKNNRFKQFKLNKKTDIQKYHFMSLMLESSLKKVNAQELQLQFKQAKIDQDLYNNQNQQILYQDKNPKPFIGNKAISNYYKHYKKLRKILDQDNIGQIKHSAYTAILQKSQSLNTFPGCYGVIKQKGDKNSLQLQNFKLGDKYTQVVSAGIKQAKQIQEYIFSKNRLTNKGFNKLLGSINQDVVKLDFSNNQIKTIDQNLMKILIFKDSKLKYLNLQNNKLGDTALQNLQLGISNNKSIQYLNLSKNFLTKLSGSHISTMIERNKTLSQLYISWNKINCQASKDIFNKLTNNKNLKVFDYSYNTLGLGGSEVVSSIVTFIKKNKTLLHFDLSFNNFNLADSKVISQGLKHNKSLYGMHFSGNYGYIDSKGFLIFDQKQQLNAYQSIKNTKINSFQIIFKRPPTFDTEAYKDVCWICQGWNELKIDKHINCMNGVYIHFSFEGYKPRYVPVINNQFKYSIMIPPGQVKYFITNFQQQQLKFEDEQFSKIYFQNQLIFKLKTDKIIKIPKNLQCNIKNSQAKKPINSNHHPEISLLPRTPDLQQRIKNKKKIWHFRDSIWARQWKRQDQDTTIKCFQRDWGHSKIPNLIKNQQDQQKCKNLLLKNYKKIKQIYKYFSSWSPFGDVWAVSANPFTQFCNQAKLVSKQLPLKIIDLTFITTNSMSGVDWKGNHQVPQRGLTRFQFMQSIVRLADQKYRKSGIYENMYDSINAIISDNLKQIYEKFQTEKWRQNQYFTQQNDVLVKKFRSLFTYIYKKYSKLKVKPGEKPFMCLDQFKQICDRCGMFSGSIVQRDCFINFNQSMMTQVDEVQNERIYRMSQIQFIQAVARMADQLSLNNLDGQLSENQRLNRSLHYKFEELIYVMIRNLGSQQFKNQYGDIKQSFFKQEKQNEED